MFYGIFRGSGLWHSEEIPGFFASLRMTVGEVMSVGKIMTGEEIAGSLNDGCDCHYTGP
jgi:hypothetical protein